MGLFKHKFYATSMLVSQGTCEFYDMNAHFSLSSFFH